MIFKILNNLLTNKAFYHFAMWPMTDMGLKLFSSLMSPSFLYTDVTRALFQSSRTIPLSSEEFTIYSSDFDIIGLANFSNLKSMFIRQRIEIVFDRRIRYVPKFEDI